MNKFIKCIGVILDHEGGYVNHPKDPGGETNMGIARMFYPDEDLKKMTKRRAQELYYWDYWQPMRLKDVDDLYAVLHIFDMGVNARSKTYGFKTVIKMVQEIVETEQDGIMGPITAAAINEMGDKFAPAFVKARIDYYKALAKRKPKLKVFLKGSLKDFWSWKEDQLSSLFLETK